LSANAFASFVGSKYAGLSTTGLLSSHDVNAVEHWIDSACSTGLIAVSTDTKFAHMVWRNTEGLLKNVKYTLAADTTGAVSRIFGVYDTATGLALRGTFIINPEGKLVTSEVNFYNVGRDAGELVRKMEANVHLMGNPSEACPAKWTPGAPTLRPGKDIVGNVASAYAN